MNNKAPDYKERTIFVPIYDQRLVLVDTNNAKKLIKHHKVETNEQPFASAYTMFGKKSRYYLIVINTNEEQIGLPIIAHECLHITNMILRDVGVKPDFNNDEAQAYLLEWIFASAMEFYELKKLNEDGEGF